MRSLSSTLSRRAFCQTGLLAGVHRVIGASAYASQIVEVGTRRQLFIDERLVFGRKGVTLQLNRPDIQFENLLLADRPWETARVMATAALNQDNRVRLWYSSNENMVDFPRRGPGARQFVDQRVCYAESSDGIRFDKPSLQELDLKAFGQNNAVMSGPWLSRVILDPFDEPAARYKSLISGLNGFEPRVAAEWPTARGASPRVLYLAHSADGKRWHLSARPVLSITIGSDRSVFWDKRLSKWVIYLRGHRPQNTFYVRQEIDRDGWRQNLPFRRMPEKNYNELPADYDRTRAAADPLTRTVLLEQEFPIVLDVDRDDPPRAHIYSMNAWKYPHAEDVYLAFVPIWYAPPGGGIAIAGSDKVDVQLALSRDGISWRRPWRMPLIPTGVSGSGGEGQIWPVCDPIVRDREIWLYYTALPYNHFDFVAPRPSQGFTARAIFRLDGFVSADSESTAGELTTHPVRFEGRVLRVNANAGAGGRLRIGLDTVEGRPIPGFSVEEAVPMIGNHLSEAASWKGGMDIGHLRSQPVRLRFAMDYCRLYAFQFGD